MFKFGFLNRSILQALYRFDILKTTDTVQIIVLVLQKHIFRPDNLLSDSYQAMGEFK